MHSDSLDSVEEVLAHIAVTASASEIAVAVEDNSVSYTYRDLWHAAGQYANAFTARNAENGILIAIDRGFHAYAAMLGALRAGIAYCPIDPRAPIERLKRISATFSGDIVVHGVGQEAWVSRIRESEIMLSLQDLPSEGKFRDVDCAPDCLAYVIFTSGTTGEPKGVSVTRRSMGWFVGQALKRLDIPTGSRWVQQVNLGFDLSVWDIFGALASESVILPIQDAVDKMFPARFVKRKRATIWQSVPSVLRAMRLAGDIEKGCLSSLELATFCGEPLPLDAVAHLRANSSARIVNTYGPTETTVFCFSSEVRSNLSDVEFAASIGSPFEGVSYWLRDGASPNDGEMVIAGMGVENDYYNVDSIPASGYFQSDFGRLAYATGDQVERVGEELFFRGRLDGQVKILGNRIELNEVEFWSSVAGYPLSCAVLMGSSVILFIEARETDVDDAPLLATLAANLPSHAVPRQIIRLSHLPRNANEKLDRRYLLGLVVRGEGDYEI